MYCLVKTNWGSNLIKQVKKSIHKKDNEFAILVLKLQDRNCIFLKKYVYIPAKTVFVEKNSEIDRSTLYNFDGPFQLLHADVENLKFSGKAAINLKYHLLFVEQDSISGGRLPSLKTQDL